MMNHSDFKDRVKALYKVINRQQKELKKLQNFERQRWASRSLPPEIFYCGEPYRLILTAQYKEDGNLLWQGFYVAFTHVVTPLVEGDETVVVKVYYPSYNFEKSLFFTTGSTPFVVCARLKEALKKAKEEGMIEIPKFYKGGKYEKHGE